MGDARTGGEVPLLFGRLLGMASRGVQASAVAAMADSFTGFRLNDEDGTLPILPIALDKETWDQLGAHGGGDAWTWDAEQKRVLPGDNLPDDDGIPEINLYPQGTGSALSRGTVDIGCTNSSTAQIARQIREGVSAADLEPFGGSLDLGSDGALELNGDPGISAAIQDDLASVVGKPRIIPIFDRVAANGNRAQFRIVRFAGVRLMEVDLSGAAKRVVIQPARVFVEDAIRTSEETPSSEHIYGRPHLVQ